MKRWTFALLAALAVLGLQGCEREPPRTTVQPPGPSSPDDTALNAPVAVPAPAPAVPAVPAPVEPPSAAASAPVVSEAPLEPAPPVTGAMGAQPAAPTAGPDPVAPGVAAPTELSPGAPKAGASAPAPGKLSALPTVRDAGDAEGARLLAQHALRLPVSGVQPTALSDNFAQGRGKRKHEAIDILAPAGTPVVAVDDGRVAKLFTSKQGGLTLYQFDRDAKLAYYYAHLQGYAPGVREGMDIKRGDVVGYVGSTGNADPGTPHLHFAIFRLGNPPKWWEGEAVNPYPALRGAEAAAAVAAR